MTRRRGEGGGGGATPGGVQSVHRPLYREESLLLVLARGRVRRARSRLVTVIVRAGRAREAGVLVARHGDSAVKPLVHRRR
jgi:hypothetical protein